MFRGRFRTSMPCAATRLPHDRLTYSDQPAPRIRDRDQQGTPQNPRLGFGEERVAMGGGVHSGAVVGDDGAAVAAGGQSDPARLVGRPQGRLSQIRGTVRSPSNPVEPPRARRVPLRPPYLHQGPSRPAAPAPGYGPGCPRDAIEGPGRRA
ncbi:hypothetical protein Sme01_19300 [Sphaerisporangium melleum]|uniref:Uncharacterized protein n=1 Tax=Sphaerisporangium melleum TaxID=321316 RepID=A0A917REX8_9ACTN|nr:hypothetical protein GCM10007964_51340 [Sphaerisporangium melleum]GII69454.1 hypothetical protein Sme01_19300 [Sphaerisporangium melleum]